MLIDLIDERKMYSLSETALLLGLNAKTIRRYMFEGRFGSVTKTGAHRNSPYKIPGTQIKNYLASRQTAGSFN